MPIAWNSHSHWISSRTSVPMCVCLHSSTQSLPISYSHYRSRAFQRMAGFASSFFPRFFCSHEIRLTLICRREPPLLGDVEPLSDMEPFSDIEPVAEPATWSTQQLRCFDVFVIYKNNGLKGKWNLETKVSTAKHEVLVSSCWLTRFPSTSEKSLNDGSFTRNPGGMKAIGRLSGPVMASD